MQPAQKKFWIELAAVSCACVGFLLLAIWGVSNWQKRWENAKFRKFVTEAQEFSAQGQYQQAWQSVREALEIHPLDLPTIRLAAHVADGTRSEVGLRFHEVLTASDDATLEDKQNYLEALMQFDKMDKAEPYLAKLLAYGPNSRTLYLAGQFYKFKNDLPRAIQYFRGALAQSPVHARTELALGSTLIQSSDPEDIQEGKAMLLRVAKGQGEFSSEALRNFALGVRISEAEAKTILALINENKKPNSSVFLLKQELRFRLNPASRPALLQEAIDAYSDGGNVERLVLASWLMNHQAYREVLALQNRVQDLANPPLLLHYMEAYNRLGQFGEGYDFSQRFARSMEDVHMEAVCGYFATKSGQPLAAEVHWTKALQLSGTSPEQLHELATIAEKLETWDQALRAWDLLALRPNWKDRALPKRLELARKMGSAKRIRDILAKAAEEDPANPDLDISQAYYDLLLNENVESATACSERLFAQAPENLNFATSYALALLRENKPSIAYQVYQKQHAAVNTFAPIHALIYAAVLFSNHRDSEAQKSIQLVGIQDFVTEEVELLKPFTDLPRRTAPGTLPVIDTPKPL